MAPWLRIVCTAGSHSGCISASLLFVQSPDLGRWKFAGFLQVPGQSMASLWPFLKIISSTQMSHAALVFGSVQDTSCETQRCSPDQSGAFPSIVPFSLSVDFLTRTILSFLPMTPSNSLVSSVKDHSILGSCDVEVCGYSLFTFLWPSNWDSSPIQLLPSL